MLKNEMEQRNKKIEKENLEEEKKMSKRYSIYKI